MPFVIHNPQTGNYRVLKNINAENLKEKHYFRNVCFF